MQFLRKIIDFYIESSIHVALACFSLVKITEICIQIPANTSVHFFAFFGTIVGYNFVKYDELARIKKIELTSTFRAIILVSICAAFATFYYFLELKTKTKVIGFAMLLLTILYTLPFFPFKKNMRNWSGIKIYLVAIAWVGVTVVLPAVNDNVRLDLVLLLYCFQQFIFIIILMLLFEINDLNNDDIKLHTIPQKIGVIRTKYLGYFLLFLFCLLGFFTFYDHFQYKSLIVFISVLIGFFLFFSSSKRNKYYTSFWVESIPIIWLVLLLFFS